MKVMNPVIGFALFSSVTLLLLSTLTPWNGYCGEKSLGRCHNMVIADMGPVLNGSVFGLVGLLVLMLAGNACFWLIRGHRSGG